MYAAQAQKRLKESSKLSLQHTLETLKASSSDDNLFLSIIQVARQVRAQSFTEEDQETIVKSMGLSFLIRLLESSSSSSDCQRHLYKSIALNLLSAICVSHSVVTDPAMVKLMKSINEALKQSSRPQSEAEELNKNIYFQINEDCCEIICNLFNSKIGLDLLVDCGTLKFLPDYIVFSNFCHSKKQLLEKLSIATKKLGILVAQINDDKLQEMMNYVADQILELKDVCDKTDHIKIAINLLHSMDSVTCIEEQKSKNWMKKIFRAVDSLIYHELKPEDSEAIMHLLSALGPEPLGVQLKQNGKLIKAIVARLEVEIYMLLDRLSYRNASERFPKLEVVYNLLCNLLQVIAVEGDTLEGDTVILVYKKLIKISQTLLDFLTNVAKHETDLPENHNIVLITVRAFAAMMSEITEEPSKDLLNLLPFFSLLCQNVEYSEDVQNEVKNLTIAAFENFRQMTILESVVDSDEDEYKQIETKSTSDNDDDCDNSFSDSTSAFSTRVDEKEKAIKDQQNHFVSYMNGNSESSDDLVAVSDITNSQSIDSQVTNEKTDESYINETELNSNLNNVGVYGRKQKQPKDIDNSFATPRAEEKTSPVNLSEESLQQFEEFKHFVKLENCKPTVKYARSRFVSDNEKQNLDNSVQESRVTDFQPDDVLRFLLPSYVFLTENHKAVIVMEKSNTFQTVTEFIQKSTSQLMEGKMSTYPESMTLNALKVVETLYSSFPSTAVNLVCFKDLMELLVHSIPNIVLDSTSPVLVCLKMIQVHLMAQKVHGQRNERGTSRSKLKHPQSRFYKSILEYFRSFYTVTRSRNVLVLQMTEKAVDIWTLAEDTWCQCLLELCSLVQTEDHLRDALSKSTLLPEILGFFHQTSVNKENIKKLGDSKSIVDSMLKLIDNCACVDDQLKRLIAENSGFAIAKKYRLNKLAKNIQDSKS